MKYLFPPLFFLAGTIVVPLAVIGSPNASCQPNCGIEMAKQYGIIFLIYGIFALVHYITVEAQKDQIK